MDRLDPRAIAPSTTEGDILTTVAGKSKWMPPTGIPIGGLPVTEVLNTWLVPLTATDENGDFVFVWTEDGELIWIEVPL